MTTMKIERAKRQQIKVPILLMGASGSGKTLSALLMAKGMLEEMAPKASAKEQWEQIGMIDTEHRRANLYVDTKHDGVTIGEFLTIDLQAPYTVERMQQAFDTLKGAGCQVIIIDSLTSAWGGLGGIKDQVDNLGGGMAAWKGVEPEQRKMLHLLVDQDVHLIATARSKQGIEVTRDDNGKIQVEKVGLKIDQKDTIEYEFAITYQLYQNHVAQAMKDNSSIFTEPGMITRDYGKKIINWAELGIDVKAEQAKKQAKAVAAVMKIVGDNTTLQQTLERAVVENNNVPVKDWPIESLTYLYKMLHTQSSQLEEQAKSDEPEQTKEKAGN